MHPFVAATDWTPSANDLSLGQVTEGWYQGRGAFGGVVAGGLLRSFARAVGDATRLPRTLNMHFCAPLKAEPFTATARIERAGNSVQHLSGRIEQDGGTIAFGSATFARSRRTDIEYRDGLMPVVPAPETVAVANNPFMPTFCQHFEYRFCVGGLPYQGATESLVGGWIRPREPLPLDYPLAVALLDASPPAIMPRFDRVRPAATVDFSMQFMEPLPLVAAAPDDHYLVVNRSRFAEDGYSEARHELWTADGRLLADARQLVAILG